MANKLLVLVCQIVTQHGRLSDIRAASDKIYIITSVRHKNYSITIVIACSKWFTACALILSYYLSLFYSYVVHSYTHTTIMLSLTIFHTIFVNFFHLSFMFRILVALLRYILFNPCSSSQATISRASCLFVFVCYILSEINIIFCEAPSKVAQPFHLPHFHFFSKARLISFISHKLIIRYLCYSHLIRFYFTDTVRKDAFLFTVILLYF